MTQIEWPCHGTSFWTPSSFCVKCIITLITPLESALTKNWGVGYGVSQSAFWAPVKSRGLPPPEMQLWDVLRLSPFPATHPKNRLLTPIIATLPKPPSASPLFATHPRPPEVLCRSLGLVLGGPGIGSATRHLRIHDEQFQKTNPWFCSANQTGFVTMEKPSIEDDAAREPLACQENSGEGTHQPCWKATANVESPFFLHFSESLREQAAICF